MRTVSDFFESLGLSTVGVMLLISILVIAKETTRITTTELLLILIVFAIGMKLMISNVNSVTNDLCTAIRTLIPAKEDILCQ